MSLFLKELEDRYTSCFHKNNVPICILLLVVHLKLASTRKRFEERDKWDLC